MNTGSFTRGGGSKFEDMGKASQSGEVGLLTAGCLAGGGMGKGSRKSSAKVCPLLHLQFSGKKVEEA